MKQEWLQEVIQRIEKLLEQSKGTPVIVAIDGRSAAGKTSFARQLSEYIPCSVFHMDDFFLRPEQRTLQRMNEIGGNVDYERFAGEVLSKIAAREPVLYRRYLCHTQTMAPVEELSYHPLSVIEGAYCMHPYFGNPYSLRIFLDITPENQIAAIQKRNGEDMLPRFLNEWIPKENAYIEHFNIIASADFYSTRM